MEPGSEKNQGVLGRLLAAPATTTLLLACILVFIAAERTGSTKDIPTLIRFGATWRGLVWEGEWWRLFSAMFLHIGVVHLVWNCWAGFQWAAPVEAVLGSWRFLVLYLLSGLAGSAVSVIGHDVVAAGASGALFGVVGSTFALLRIKLGSWKALWQHPVHQKNLGMATLWFVVGAFAGFDNFAHAGGLAAGLGLTWALRPDVRGAQLGPRLGFVGAALAAIVLASVRPLPLLHEPARRFALARAADESGDFDRVLSLTDAWKVTGAAEDGTALTLRTRALSEKARWPETEATATQAIQLRPDFAYLFQIRALARSHLGRDQEAIADCREAQRLAPEEPWPLEFEAELHLEAGAFDDAEQRAQKALELGPTLRRAILRADALRRLGRIDEALAVLSHDAGAADEASLAWKAEELARLDRWEEAEALLASLDAGSADVRKARCLIHLDAQEHAKAAAACARADPSAPEVQWAMALLDLHEGRPERARRLAEAELARKRAPATLMLLAGVFVVEGDRAQADRLAAEARAAGSKDPDLLQFEALLAWTPDGGR